MYQRSLDLRIRISMRMIYICALSQSNIPESFIIYIFFSPENLGRLFNIFIVGG